MADENEAKNAAMI